VAEGAGVAAEAEGVGVATAGSSDVEGGVRKLSSSISAAAVAARVTAAR
jgi:hypothetical protein